MYAILFIVIVIFVILLVVLYKAQYYKSGGNGDNTIDNLIARNNNISQQLQQISADLANISNEFTSVQNQAKSLAHVSNLYPDDTAKFKSNVGREVLNLLVPDIKSLTKDTLQQIHNNYYPNNDTQIYAKNYIKCLMDSYKTLDVTLSEQDAISLRDNAYAKLVKYQADMSDREVNDLEIELKNYLLAFKNLNNFLVH